MKNKKIVLFQGAFDIINYGHVRAFEFAKKHGDYLIVAVNSNALLEKYKGRAAVLPWSHKAKIIGSFRMVDKVVVARYFSPMALLRKYRPAVYVIGSEWIESKAKEIAYVKSYGGKIAISPRFRGVIPTSEIKRRLLAEAKAVLRG
jgi:cytidyltransferase-like protein